MSGTLADQDAATLRTAAYGAVAPADATGRPHKIATNGSIALSSATGPVGHVLAARSKDTNPTGRNTAELADQVLPAPTAAVRLREQQHPAEADDFRGTVLVAIEAATQPHKNQPIAAMTRQITAALDAA
ncbi:hypothetical protein ACRS6B_10935 [Nocardia asteroides]